MNFTAPAFVLGLPLVLLLHRLCPHRARWALLLAASLAFYAVGSPQALPLLLAITGGSYAAALAIDHCRTPLAKKAWCGAAALLCLGCLAWFKYAPLAGVSVLLPAGLSFYTFQALGYVMDVARGRLPAERHPGYFALFVSFFPQLVAGPIERSTDLLPQLHAQNRTPDPAGWLWLLRGFAKKLLLADALAPYVDGVYANPAAAPGPAVLLATALFAAQIYFDFSGYSDIAVGAAALLGIRLTRNFNHPYAAASIHDFWRRWHISLTRWLTDYLYIPLGGSRCGAARHTVNVLLVFLASGAWHGGAGHYILWGAAHGLLMAAETALDRRGTLGKIPLPARRALTLVLVGGAWVFFRAESVPAAFTLFGRLLTGWGAAPAQLAALGLPTVARLALAATALHLLPNGDLKNTTPAALLGVFCVLLATGAAWLAALGSGSSAFLYFQF